VAVVSLPGGGEEVVMMEAVGAQGLAVAVDANPEALETVQLDLSNHGDSLINSCNCRAQQHHG